MENSIVEGEGHTRIIDLIRMCDYNFEFVSL